MRPHAEEQPRANFPSLHDHDELSARTARGRSEAAGDVIEPDLGALDLVPCGVHSRAAVDASDHSTAGAPCVRDLGQVHGTHQVQESLRLLLGVPSYPFGRVVN